MVLWLWVIGATVSNTDRYRVSGTCPGVDTDQDGITYDLAGCMTASDFESLTRRSAITSSLEANRAGPKVAWEDSRDPRSSVNLMWEFINKKNFCLATVL